jgi:hypothetical protein
MLVFLNVYFNLHHLIIISKRLLVVESLFLGNARRGKEIK